MPKIQHEDGKVARLIEGFTHTLHIVMPCQDQCPNLVSLCFETFEIILARS